MTNAPLGEGTQAHREIVRKTAHISVLRLPADREEVARWRETAYLPMDPAQVPPAR